MRVAGVDQCERLGWVKSGNDLGASNRVLGEVCLQEEVRVTHLGLGALLNTVPQSHLL